jgi:hypothetical protein
MLSLWFDPRQLPHRIGDRQTCAIRRAPCRLTVEAQSENSSLKNKTGMIIFVSFLKVRFAK